MFLKERENEGFRIFGNPCIWSQKSKWYLRNGRLLQNGGFGAGRCRQFKPESETKLLQHHLCVRLESVFIDFNQPLTGEQKTPGREAPPFSYLFGHQFYLHLLGVFRVINMQFWGYIDFRDVTTRRFRPKMSKDVWNVLNICKLFKKKQVWG